MAVLPSLPLILPGEVLIRPLAGERYLIFNVHTRDNLVCNAAGLALLAALQTEGSWEGITSRCGESGFMVQASARFNNVDGLLSDPGGVRPDLTPDHPPPVRLAAPELAERFVTLNLLIGDREVYGRRFGLRRNPVDRFHFGSFHQQLIHHLVVEQGINPAVWWPRQKFTPDLNQLGENLYRDVQGNFLRELFATRLHPGMRIADLGCGVGLFARWMAERGAAVVGVDPNPDYIAQARERNPEENPVEFVTAPLGTPGALEFIPDSSLDVVFISDALLFYFMPLGTATPPDLGVLCAELRRILRPGGQWWSLEPHYNFWLAPRWGDPERPFTLLGEYRHRRYLVTPTPTEMISAITAQGFLLRSCRDVYAAQESTLAGAAFHREFPLWQFMEFQPE